jgi:hypothetical protein
MLIAAGFILGLLVGRWWALTAAIGFGVWVAIVSEVEVPGWFLGLWYSAIGCVGIGTGIAVRRAIHRLEAHFSLAPGCSRLAVSFRSRGAGTRRSSACACPRR